MKDAAKLGVERDAGVAFRYIQAEIDQRLTTNIKLDASISARSIVDKAKRQRNLDLEEVLVRAVAHLIEQRRRAITREQERPKEERRTERVIEDIARAIEAHTEKVTIAAFDKLLAVEFALPGGKRVAWGEATIAQHRARVKFDKGQIGGLLEDAAQHESAIETIRAGHVQRLNDLRSRNHGPV
jgi:hypothetical protein